MFKVVQGSRKEQVMLFVEGIIGGRGRAHERGVITVDEF
jgi:hypothetical protein